MTSALLKDHAPLQRALRMVATLHSAWRRLPPHRLQHSAMSAEQTHRMLRALRGTLARHQHHLNPCNSEACGPTCSGPSSGGGGGGEPLLLGPMCPAPPPPTTGNTTATCMTRRGRSLRSRVDPAGRSDQLAKFGPSRYLRSRADPTDQLKRLGRGRCLRSRADPSDQLGRPIFEVTSPSGGSTQEVRTWPMFEATSRSGGATREARTRPPLEVKSRSGASTREADS